MLRRGTRTGPARPAVVATAVAVSLGLLAACDPTESVPPAADVVAPRVEEPSRSGRAADDPPRGVVTLAFAGDMHFELQHRALLQRPARALDRIAGVLGDADVTMVNLETAVTDRDDPEPKKYTFRTDERALDVLAAAGVDVASLANNHGVDHGRAGLRDTLAARRDGPLPLVGVGRDKADAFRPWTTRVGSTDLAFLAASSRREYTLDEWSATDDSAGVAAARHPRAPDLADAVRSAARTHDVVVVYLHWGDEYARCPDRKQRTTARTLTRAGADVIVGTHAHVLQGGGWLESGGETAYVGYGLGNFLWYHNYRREDTGVLTVRIRDGEVVGDRLRPAYVGVNGTVPRPLRGEAADRVVRDWARLRGCTGLAAAPPAR